MNLEICTVVQTRKRRLLGLWTTSEDIVDIGFAEATVVPGKGDIVLFRTLEGNRTVATVKSVSHDLENDTHKIQLIVAIVGQEPFPSPRKLRHADRVP